MVLIPEDFVAQVHELYGHQGDVWLRGLPELLERCESRFGITLQAPFSDLSWNLILDAERHDGTPVVIKIIVLKEELSRELSALQAYARRGGIHVIDADDNLGVLVLERAVPGTPLSSIEDDNLATQIFCNIFKHLHCPPGTGPYISIKDRFLAFDRYCHRFEDDAVMGPIPSYWVDRASECLTYLLASTNEDVLLHGDLHHDNILLHQARGWTVIDPKGIIGDRHFDTIQYLLNYEERGGIPYTVLDRRIGIISDSLGLDPRRIAMWGIARGVLEACWAIEDERDDWDKGIQITERFAEYLG